MRKTVSSTLCVLMITAQRQVIILSCSRVCCSFKLFYLKGTTIEVYNRTNMNNTESEQTAVGYSGKLGNLIL